MSEAASITVRVPLAIRRRPGRKTVVTPDGAAWAPRPLVNNAMVKALARAFRWQRMLDDGVCGTIEELARRERVNRGYLSRVLRLTLLAPDVVVLSDAGGLKQAARKPVVGADKVARFLAARWDAVGARTTVEPAQVNGAPAVILRLDGELDGVVAALVEDGLVTGLYFMRNPEKLSHVARETALSR